MELTPPLTSISGMAPECKILSLKVMDTNENGTVRGVLAALQYIQRLNGYGRRLLVHGVNLSVGYDFEPEWFACGQSPLCVEVDRLVQMQNDAVSSYDIPGTPAFLLNGEMVKVEAGSTPWEQVEAKIKAALGG